MIMILTDKCKEYFSYKYNMSNFNEYSEVLQSALIIEFFDSVGIYIEINVNQITDKKKTFLIVFLKEQYFILNIEVKKVEHLLLQTHLIPDKKPQNKQLFTQTKFTMKTKHKILIAISVIPIVISAIIDIINEIKSYI